MALRDEGSIEGVQFTNMTIETRMYGRFWWGGGEPISVTAMPRDLATTVGAADAGCCLYSANCSQECQTARQRPALPHGVVRKKGPMNFQSCIIFLFICRNPSCTLRCLRTVRICCLCDQKAALPAPQHTLATPYVVEVVLQGSCGLHDSLRLC